MDQPKTKSTTCRRASPLCHLDPLLREPTTIHTTEIAVVTATTLVLDIMTLHNRLPSEAMVAEIHIKRALDLLPDTAQAKMTDTTVLAHLPRLRDRKPVHTVHPTTRTSTSATIRHLALIIALPISIVLLCESLRARAMVIEIMIAVLVVNVVDAVAVVVVEAQEWRLNETS